MRLKTVKSCLHKPQSKFGKGAKRDYQNITKAMVRPHGPDPERHKTICYLCWYYGVAQPGHGAGRDYSPGFLKGRTGSIQLYGVSIARDTIPLDLLDALEG